jgi:flagellar motility protein MotE (MotC chaperone)
VLRLQEFEQKQAEFQRIQTEFLEEVVYSEKGPGPEEYKKFYEAANPASWEYVYRQVVTQLEEDQKFQDYAKAYAEMKPKEVAGVFEEMTDNLDLVAKILNAMSVEDRAKILGAMDAGVAAKLTKMMDPDS